MSDNVCDMRRGVYRRLYAGMRMGRRINAVSVDAALLFWHLHTAADDFGNLSGDPYLCRIEAAPMRREWDDDRIGTLLEELASVTAEKPLIHFYDVDGERHVHICGFLERQPAGKNGRRIRKYPRSPFEDDELAAAAGPGESGGIQIIPGELSAPHIHTHTQDHSENENHTQPPNQHQSEYEIQTQGQHGNGPTNETPSSVNTPMTRAKVSLGTGSLSRTGGEGGVGGLGSALRRSVGQDLKRQLEVQKVLAEVGVAGDVQRELYQRKDITAAVVRRIWSKVQKCKDIDDPVAVLVHRLRNYRG